MKPDSARPTLDIFGRLARYALQPSSFPRPRLLQSRLTIFDKSLPDVVSWSFEDAVAGALHVFSVFYQRLNDRRGLLVKQVQCCSYALKYEARHARIALSQSAANAQLHLVIAGRHGRAGPLPAKRPTARGVPVAWGAAMIRMTACRPPNRAYRALHFKLCRSFG